MQNREHSRDKHGAREDDCFLGARKAISRAYERTTGKHPTTAEVMNAYDQLVGLQRAANGSFVGHSQEVVKILLAVARRNTDGRWLSNLYLYKKELERSEESFSSQKTHKKSVREVNDRTRIASYLSQEDDGGREGRSASQQTKKESFFKRVSTSNSPERQSPDEEASQHSNYQEEESSQSEEINPDTVPIPEQIPPKPSTYLMTTKRDMSSVIIPTKLKINRSKSTNKSSVALVEDLDQERIQSPKAIKILESEMPILPPEQEPNVEGPTVTESAYAFYRVRLLTKSMYAFQTSTAFAKRLTAYLSRRKQLMTIESKVTIFFLLKYNMEQTKRVTLNEQKATTFLATKTLKDGMTRWKLYVQVQRKEKIICKAFRQRANKRLMLDTLTTMNRIAKERKEIRDKAVSIERFIAESRVLNRVLRSLDELREARRNKHLNQRLTRHLKTKAFHLLRATVHRAKELNRQKRLAEEMADSQLKITLLTKAFSGWHRSKQRTLELEEVAELHHLKTLIRKCFQGVKIYKNMRKSEIPIYSDRQKFLGLKYFGLLGIEKEKTPRDLVPEADLEGERVGWSVTSRAGSEDYHNRIGVTSFRNQIVDRLSTIVPCNTERFNTRRMKEAIESFQSQLLTSAFRKWRMRVLQVKEYLEQKEQIRKQKMWNDFVGSVNKSILLKNNYVLIETRKESALKEIYLGQWRDIFRMKQRSCAQLEKARNYYTHTMLSKLFSHWKSNYMKEMATERKVRHYERNVSRSLLSKSMDALKLHLQQNRTKARFENFVASFYIRSLFSKSFIGLKSYAKYRQAKKQMRAEYTPALKAISLKRPLRAMYHVLAKRSTVRNFVAFLETLTKKKVLHKMHAIMKDQDQKVKAMRNFGKNQVLKRSTFQSWLKQAKIQIWQREQIVVLQEKSVQNHLRMCLMRWVYKIRVEREVIERGNAAADFYDIKILVITV